MGRPAQPVWDRISRKIAIDTESGCWEWTAGCSRYGYGMTFVGTRRDGTLRHISAHRLVYQIHRGDIPEGLTLDHLCRNRKCVNPDHLEPVTNAENLLRGESPIARGFRDNVCRRGHPLTPDNVYLYQDGSRRCRTCHLDYKRRVYERKTLQRTGSIPKPPHKLRTHCPHGHPYEGANLYIYKGKRECRECRRINTLASRRRAALARAR